MKPARAGLAGVAFSSLLAGSALAATAPGDWPTANREPGGARFSPLTQLTPANVAGLREAWIYHMRPGAAVADAPSQAEADQARAEGASAARPTGLAPSASIPLVVGDRMYLATPYGRVVALDAASGRELWTYALPDRDQPAVRGVEYWPGDGRFGPTVVFGTRNGRLISVDASTGQPTAGFGDNGIVDLKSPDVLVTGPDHTYGLGSPPIVYRNLLITGALTGEGLGGAVGDTRAWDARTGKLVWTFHSVPHRGEPGFGTWAGDSGKNRSGVNVWGLMTVDPRRGVVYMPFGAPVNDRIGVDRAGDNLFSSSVVAADAATGKYLWHFQLTHHDVWDMDAQSPPLLFDLKRGGRTIPAVALTSKASLLFILDRATGKPLYKVEERAVPASDVPGEATSPTQPFPVAPEPLSRITATRADLAKVTPEHEAFCRKLVEDNDILLGGPYLPSALNRPTVNFPGILGGVNWAGASLDPRLGYYVVNVSNFGQVQHVQAAPGTPLGYVIRGPSVGRFWNTATRLPCQAPPWGQLVAVDLNTGKVAWRSTLGVSDNLPPDKQATGRPSLGGPISTAGGLTFIAATDDGRFRAFDTRTGTEVWTVRLPGSAHTNPITYAENGKQYVAVVATGGAGFLGTPVTSDSLVVYALPMNVAQGPARTPPDPLWTAQ